MAGIGSDSKKFVLREDIFTSWLAFFNSIKGLNIGNGKRQYTYTAWPENKERKFMRKNSLKSVKEFGRNVDIDRRR